MGILEEEMASVCSDNWHEDMGRLGEDGKEERSKVKEDLQKSPGH